MALLIVVDPGVDWSSTRPFPVVALVPSLLGTLWAGRHLNRIWTILLGALASTTLVERGTHSNRGVFRRIILGSVARLLLGTFAASVVVFFVIEEAPANEGALMRLLLGLGAFGLVSFLVALLESFSRLTGALFVTIAALAAGVLVLTGPWALPGGSALVVSAAAAAAAAVHPVSRLVRMPDRTLATML
ncbi:MAG: hypothetical protein ACLGIA_03025 [Actinomycetes bacterium]